jgi:hypothetical protein
MNAGAAAKSIFRTMMHFLSGMRHWRKLFTGPPVPRGRDHIFAIGANAERVRCGMQARLDLRVRPRFAVKTQSSFGAVLALPH